ncbi:ORF22 [Spodoptera exigua multiple nucleopolyhedrovirus]|uniref:ORF22 n=1 Tax=Spodoptera exigua nuclear polyhedrosis virus (strain US) TaxID=31506 RepID=Q9J8B3_NPVSE|nr:ORF22 [Spodoptera exigua multiple nucleopolyhedrovirus]AAF33552.1 ORF22 [Spodoptera exigua multiple nucleopolyhedrovirus]
MSKTTLLTLTIILLEFSHSMLNSLIGIPRYRVLKDLSELMYGDNSLLMTRLEIITGVVTFAVSLFFVLCKLKKKNALRYKATLLMLPMWEHRFDNYAEHSHRL